MVRASDSKGCSKYSKYEHLNWKLYQVNVAKFGEPFKMATPSQAITEILLKDGYLLKDKL